MAKGATITVFDCPDWILKNSDDFKPPVCNKCMFNDQLKVFFVGGPNQRKDFHLELGEELFYQVEGDMVLKVIEKGKPRDIPIKQGDLFLLPARVEVGCVVERTREKDELDCLRYFVDGSTEVLWERWFHLDDVVKDLPPIIREFQQSQENKSGVVSGKVGAAPSGSYSVDSKADLGDPIPLADFIAEHMNEINNKAPFQVYGPPTNKSLVMLYGRGHHKVKVDSSEELIIMTVMGEVKIQGCGGEEPEQKLGPFFMARMKPNSECQLDVPDGSVCITVNVN